MPEQVGRKRLRKGNKRLVRLYVVDAEALQWDFDRLSAKMDFARRTRVRQYGNTPQGRRCLGAGLLMNRVLGKDVVENRMRFNAQGKPYLGSGPCFNLTHAGRHAALAVSLESVGVDMENAGRKGDWQRIAERFFHVEEQAYIAAAEDPKYAFYAIWTLKESYLKAMGAGFSIAPGSFCVLPDGTTGATVTGDGDMNWRFRRYEDFLPDYHLAVCARERDFCAAPEVLTF